MYDYIGEKIKNLAKVLGWICIIAGVIAALALWFGAESFLAGLAALIVGALSYAGTWVMYGFGQLVENTSSTHGLEQLVEDTSAMHDSIEKMARNINTIRGNIETLSYSIKKMESQSAEPLSPQQPAAAAEAVETEREDIAAKKIGATLTMGTYPQDGNSDSEKQKIEWTVLDKKGNSLLLISKYGLESKPYNTKRTNVTWETSTLRDWLNSDFINAVFTGYERAKIRETIVTADKNPSYSTNPGNDTKDKIFLLSTDEVNKYFNSNNKRMCASTAYAKAHGAYKKDGCKVDGEAACQWWLRSPGCNQYSATIVGHDGGILSYGRSVDVAYECVRPAMWIDLS